MLTYTKVRPVLHVEVTASVLKPDLYLRRKIVGDSQEALGKNGCFEAASFLLKKGWLVPCHVGLPLKQYKRSKCTGTFCGWRPKSLVFLASFAGKQSFDFCEGLTARQRARKHAVWLAQSLVIYNTLHEPVHNQGTVFFHCPAPRKSSLITNAPWLHSRFMISFLFEGFGFRVASRHFQQLRTTS